MGESEFPIAVGERHAEAEVGDEVLFIYPMAVAEGIAVQRDIAQYPAAVQIDK